MRASSVDFTFSRSAFDVNPPLPPPQEPMQRLRARSFSYSAAYGSSGYNPPPPGYGKPFGMMMTNQQPQMPPTLSPDFPQTLRGFHNGPRGPPSGSQHMPQHMSQTQPPPAGVRPPRVNIPADSPLHQYHQVSCSESCCWLAIRSLHVCDAVVWATYVVSSILDGCIRRSAVPRFVQ